MWQRINIYLIAALAFASLSSCLAQDSKLRGPIVDAGRSPYIIAYTLPLDGEDASAIRMTAEKFQKDLSPEASSLCKQLKVEKEITQNDIENYNILLFTIFRHSSLLQRLKGKLPISIGDDSVTLGKRKYEGNVGIVFITPNPLNPAKYLLVFGATNRETLLHITDFGEYYDDPVDYFIFTIEKGETQPLKREAGIFDKEGGQWRVYPNDVPLDKVRWDWNSQRDWKGALRKILWNVVRCFPQDALIIYGTQSDDEKENEAAREMALRMQRFVKDELTFLKVKADKDVSKEELKSKNLVLFGTPKSNWILKQIADKLPIKFRGKFIIAKAPYAGEWVGLIMGLPNIFNPQKYMLIYTGVTYKGIFYNVWPDPKYDYVIFKNSPTGPHGAEADIILEVGIFDKSDPLNWKLKEEGVPLSSSQ